LTIVFAGFAYLVFGAHLPKYMAHTGFSFEESINFMFFSTEGILGLPLGVSGTVIIVFLMFGSFLVMSGAGSFFIDLGLSLFGTYRGGPAKAAVLGSCMFGSITGSQVANVAAVGVLTIPLMKRVGYRPIVAASIEALASTGGMLIPPVMGAVAFIIRNDRRGLDVCKSLLSRASYSMRPFTWSWNSSRQKFGLRGLPLSGCPVQKGPPGTGA
jgi:TRAP-type uncharacterized transport system fused permease subunit